MAHAWEISSQQEIDRGVYEMKTKVEVCVLHRKSLRELKDREFFSHQMRVRRDTELQIY